MSGLQIRAVRKRFGATEVLHGIDLDAVPGEVTALIGQNGAGKSTLFRIIMGLIRADAGSATVGGRDVLSVPLHHKHNFGLGYLAQDVGSLPQLTVAENIDVIAELLPIDAAERSRRVVEAIERTGLTDLRNRPFELLSGGEQRRTEIAKVLIQQPRVLLLDEPFSGLDPRIVDDLGELVRGLAADGVAVLLTDHNVHLTLPHADRAYVIGAGMIVCHGTPAEVASDAAARSAYFGDTFRWST